MERASNGVRVGVLATSIYPRNMYDTFVVDMNIASIALKMEYNASTYSISFLIRE